MLKLKEDIPKIKHSPNVFVFADKTSNIYQIPEQRHKKILRQNITKTYKKFETSINLEIKTLPSSSTRTPAFITLNYHKPDFRQNPSCRLINPAKNELGKFRKLIIEKIDFRKKIKTDFRTLFQPMKEYRFSFEMVY